MARTRARARTAAFVVATSIAAALGLTSCASPATAFHLAGATPATSKVNAGELQLFAGTYTFAADSSGDVGDLRWTVTYGNVLFPGANPVATADGVASTTVDLAPPTGSEKRYYQVCLSSIANPLARTCQVYVVGADAAMVGQWVFNPFALQTTVDARSLHAQLFVLNHVGPALDGPMASPFLFTQTIEDPNGGPSVEVWAELVSPWELWLALPGGPPETGGVLKFIRTA